MSKPFKIVAIVVGALVVLCLLALVLIPSFIPLESMITQTLNESTGPSGEGAFGVHEHPGRAEPGGGGSWRSASFPSSASAPCW